MDRGLLEFLGPDGIANQLYRWSRKLSTVEFSMIFHYHFMMLLGLLTLFIFLIQGLFLITFIDLRLIILIILFIGIQIGFTE
jgi:hypothetical protein